MSEPIVEPVDLGSPTCAIGPGAAFDGILSFWGLARVDGRLRGEVAAEGTLEVGPDADVHARVAVDVLIVEGLVEGEVVARERLEVRATGRITASVRTPRLVLADGGRIEGRLEMGSPTKSSAATPNAPASAA